MDLSFAFQWSGVPKRGGGEKERASIYGTLWVGLCEVAVFPAISIFRDENEEIGRYNRGGKFLVFEAFGIWHTFRNQL